MFDVEHFAPCLCSRGGTDRGWWWGRDEAVRRHWEPDPLEEGIREFYLEEVGRFVRKAREVAGVQRIALVGSILTTKRVPKDVDLLLSVDDDVELGELAVLGRRLQGTLQGRNKTADVFLASASGPYLGRLCRWRDCRPGLRVACRAEHCGRRKHLYDDLHVLKLARSLVEEPPLELWPEVIRRVPLPADVEAWLERHFSPVAPST